MTESRARGTDPFFSLLDQLRAVAALLVVYSHLVGNFLESNGRAWVLNNVVVHMIEQPLGIMIHFGWVGVAMFFYISGFVITRAATRESGSEFALKRLLRIYPPVIFAVAIAMLLSQFGILVVGVVEPPTLGEGALAATLANWFIPAQPLSILAVGWTLAIEVLFYLGMLALRPVLARIPALVPVLLLALPLLATFALPIADYALSTLIAYLSFVPLLVLGQVLYLVRSGTVSVHLGVVLVLAAATTHVLALNRTMPAFVDPSNSYQANSALMFLLFVLAVLAEGRVRPSRVLAVVAARSYSLYLLHVPVGFTLAQILVTRAEVPYPVALVAALAATALATEASYRFIERPSMALGRRFARARRMRASGAARSENSLRATGAARQ